MSDGKPIEYAVGALLAAQKRTLALAESCTGGLITHLVTNVPGSSAYLQGAIVAYSYEAKVKLLGVNNDDLVKHGAVSEIIAQQMAHGARLAFGTDVAISVTGIAGPGGGLPNKPVGLTYIGLDAPDYHEVICCHWTGSRDGNKHSSANAALELLFRYLSRG